MLKVPPPSKVTPAYGNVSASNRFNFLSQENACCVVTEVSVRLYLSWLRVLVFLLIWGVRFPPFIIHRIHILSETVPFCISGLSVKLNDFGLLWICVASQYCAVSFFFDELAKPL